MLFFAASCTRRPPDILTARRPGQPLKAPAQVGSTARATTNINYQKRPTPRRCIARTGAHPIGMTLRRWMSATVSVHTAGNPSCVPTPSRSLQYEQGIPGKDQRRHP
jgi:hypothetical protein